MRIYLVIVVIGVLACQSNTSTDGSNGDNTVLAGPSGEPVGDIGGRLSTMGLQGNQPAESGGVATLPDTLNPINDGDDMNAGRAAAGLLHNAARVA